MEKDILIEFIVRLPWGLPFPPRNASTPGGISTLAIECRMVYPQCTRCGRELKGRARYCPHCGASVLPGATLPGKKDAAAFEPADRASSTPAPSGAAGAETGRHPPRSLAALLLLCSLLVFLLAWFAAG
ncbi:MAG: zinc ribbon domain-containing protein [Acidobacteria bacterium]|nr:zinc ribbon domain-containing protein [Acidobacteriota bacterium]